MRVDSLYARKLSRLMTMVVILGKMYHGRRGAAENDGGRGDDGVGKDLDGGVGPQQLVLPTDALLMTTDAR